MSQNPAKQWPVALLLLAMLLTLLLLSTRAVQSQAEITAVSIPESGADLSSFAAEKATPEDIDAAFGKITVDPLEPVSVIVTFADAAPQLRALETAVSGQIIHRYTKVFNGVSMVLPGGKVDALANMPTVSGVYLDTVQQLDTETSPGFIGAPTLWNSLGGQDDAGEGVIVGVLDSGIWPEHPSMSDPDPFGNPFPAPPTAPGSNGFGSGGPRDTCDFGNTAANSDDAPFTCNNKLIGAYQFLDTYKAIRGLLPTEFDSARDDNGHGTHTATTAAGNGGVAASIFGVPFGTVSGVAPRAHVIAYRVCGDTGCFQSDSVAAVEQAILDGVDAINFSISGGGSPYSDAVEQAFAVAYDNGVFVSASAGNSGPTPETVAHRGPWTMTVAASTSNRHFLSTVSLTADNGDTLTLTGASVTDGIGTETAVIFPPAGQIGCLTPFAPGTFNGEIVICERGVIARVEKSYNVAAGGAGGLLLYNPVQQGLSTDNHFIPSVHLENDSGDELLDFMDSHSGVTGTFTAGTATAVPGDVMAPFSSRGGPAQNLGISKPDITAPGVQILAGNTPLPATVTGGLPGQLFQAIQGTSMSSPHVAGSGALLRALHPDWTPGQIKSAIMLSAQTNVMKEDGSTPTNPFDDGSGRVDLSKAGSVGLTMDETAANYILLEDELWKANYPSLYVPNLAGSLTVERTVHNETSQKREWKLTVSGPSDLVVTVPKTITVPGNGDATFSITVDASTVPLGQVRHATLTLKQGNNRLTFPITIVRGQSVVAISKTCDPGVIEHHDNTDCTITLTNNSTSDATVHLEDFMPQPLRLVKGSVVGADEKRDGLTFDGTLYGAAPPVIDITDTAAPFGYFPLASLGAGPRPCPANCDDGGIVLTVPAFAYLGQSYNQVIWSVNGTLEVGIASGVAASATNQNLPNPSAPNNILAPWWTDLDLGAGGNWYVAVLTAGANQYTVYEWANVPRWGDNSSKFSFQIWVQNGSSGNIWFAYGPSSGNTGDGTVGAENSTGTLGKTVYFDGTGTLPWGSADRKVTYASGAPGETHVITFSAEGKNIGQWTNCARMTSDVFEGTAVSCFTGEVIP